MIVDAGDQLQLCAVGQEHRRGDVQLPQLHRRFSLPPLVVLAAPLALAGRYQAAADQNPVDGGPGRHRRHVGFTELVLQPSWSPSRMGIPQLADHRLDIGVQLARLEPWPVGMISQPG
jgi:hypothetical protein